MKGGKLDFKALLTEQNRGRPQFEVENGAAIISVKGVLTPGMSFFSFFFDEASTTNIQKNIQAALDDSEIERMILDMDTPGGAVKGTFELADFIFEAAKQKPIDTFSAGTIASGGMLIAAATNKIFITGKTNLVGSIGVIARKVDLTKMQEMEGLSIEEFVTGKFKNLLSSDRKTDDEEREEIQSMVDKQFIPMVADISSRRGLDPQEIIDMQGRVFIGQESIENGLVDGVSTLEELINNQTGVSLSNFKNQVTMDKVEFQAKHPELFKQLDKEAYERGEGVGEKSGATTGAEAERTRIDGISQACFPGQEELCATMIADGKTQPGEAAIRFNSAEKQTRVDAGKQTSTAMPAAVDSSEPKAKKVEEKKTEAETEAKTPEQEFEASAELKAEFTDIDEYKAFLSANEGGQVNIFKGGSK